MDMRTAAGSLTAATCVLLASYPASAESQATEDGSFSNLFSVPLPDARRPLLESLATRDLAQAPPDPLSRERVGIGHYDRLVSERVVGVRPCTYPPVEMMLFYKGPRLGALERAEQFPIPLRSERMCDYYPFRTTDWKEITFDMGRASVEEAHAACAGADKWISPVMLEGATLCGLQRLSFSGNGIFFSWHWEGYNFQYNYGRSKTVSAS